jgi:hypothetical protein
VSVPVAIRKKTSNTKGLIIDRTIFSITSVSTLTLAIDENYQNYEEEYLRIDLYLLSQHIPCASLITT